MLLLVQLRWLAVAGQVVTILTVNLGLGIPLPARAMFLVALALVALNLVSLLRLRRPRAVTNAGLFMALLLDVAALTAQLYLSGGASNPFAFLYLLQIALGAVLLDAWSIWALVLVALACFAGLTEFSRPIVFPLAVSADPMKLQVEGMLVCFVLEAILLVVFGTRIGANLRMRDARLAELRQQAAEEDHIVRMGLLASGAAHELGTPLATLSVILSDWKRMPALAADAELAQEIGEMQAEVQRCKAIVTGILLSAGEARGEAPAVTTVNGFLDELVEDWTGAHAATHLAYDNDFGEDLPIVSDAALKKMIVNVMDNASEASPGWIGLSATREANALVLEVVDRGPGFGPGVLAQFGRPYNSTKGRAGAGLGIFLVVNALRKLGGGVAARNRAEGGASVTLTLPLAALSIGGGNGG
nr:ATP-binding protein [Faunimonas pinastri]